MTTDIADGWIRVMSATHGLPYYVHVKKKISRWTLPNEKVYARCLRSSATRGFAWAVVNKLHVAHLCAVIVFCVHFRGTRSMSPPHSRKLNRVSMPRRSSAWYGRTSGKGKVNFLARSPWRCVESFYTDAIPFRVCSSEQGNGRWGSEGENGGQ